MSAAHGKPVADVAVVIPFYNGHQFIQRALDSVTGQTVLPKQVIVVDDGSQQAFELPATYRPADTEVVVIRHDQNRGIPAARNTGIRAARTEWVAFLDQDDEWIEDKIQRQMEYLRGAARPVTAVFGGMRVAETGRAIPRPPISRWLSTNPGGVELAVRLLQEGNFVPWGTMVVHHGVFESVGLLDESFRGGSDDYDFVIRASVAERLEWGVKEHSSMLIRHEHHGNYSRADRFFADTTRILAKWMAADDSRLSEAARQALGREWFALARYHHRSSDFVQAIECYRRALRFGTGKRKRKAAMGLLLAGVHVRR